MTAAPAEARYGTSSRLLFLALLVLLALLSCVGARAAESQSIAVPAGAAAGSEDEHVFEDGDLGAPGALYDSNFTDANKCPACCAFAAAIRRENYDTAPRAGAKDRHAGLVADERVEDIIHEALIGIVDHYVFVPSRGRYAPLVYAKAAAGVLTQEQLAMAEKHVEVHGDQKLLDFLHVHLREVYGEEAESLARRDVEKGRLPTDFVRKSAGEPCDFRASAECLDRKTSMVLLKDKSQDRTERVRFAKVLCSKECGKRDPVTALPLESDDLGTLTVLEVEKQKAEERAAQEAEAAATTEAAKFDDGSAASSNGDASSDHRDDATEAGRLVPPSVEEREAEDLAAIELERAKRAAAGDTADAEAADEEPIDRVEF